MTNLGTTHLEDGTIVALRDGALVSGDARLHLEGCGRCNEALEQARRRAGLVADALASMTAPVDVEKGKAAARARMDARRAAERPRYRWSMTHLGRAAALVLVAGGAVYALPGSPLASWIRDRAAAPTSVEPATADVQETPDLGGIEVDVPAGGIRVALRAVDASATVEVVWVDRPVARVAAGEGSSYAFAEGLIEAVVASGPVRVELYRAAASVTLQINGRMVLQGSPAAPRIVGGTPSADGDRIVFEPTER